jgi:hypothetical protein
LAKSPSLPRGLLGPIAATVLLGPFVAIRIARWLPHPAFKNLGARELREFVIAWFLMWYVISYAVRLRRMPGVGEASPIAKDHAELGA